MHPARVPTVCAALAAVLFVAALFLEHTETTGAFSGLIGDKLPTAQIRYDPISVPAFALVFAAFLAGAVAIEAGATDHGERLGFASMGLGLLMGAGLAVYTFSLPHTFTLYINGHDMSFDGVPGPAIYATAVACLLTFTAGWLLVAAKPRPSTARAWRLRRLSP